jgi:hypothetical protein
MTLDVEKMKARELAAPRVEACIAEVMARFPRDSKEYYVEVHQHLAPLARQLERERDEIRAEVERLGAEADRYRWLRDKSEPGICAFYLSVGQAFKGVKFAPETVDEAIDAAIGSHTKAGKPA